MANKLHCLLLPLLETRLGFTGTPALSISATKRAFGSTGRPDSQRVADDISSHPPELLTKDGIKLNDSTIQEEEEEEEEENSVYVNKETGEVCGPRGPEPTRYGDFERNGRCCDF